MKILITGGGVVGTYTALEAETRGHEPVLFELKPDINSIKSVWKNANIITGDITNKEGLSKSINDISPDAIIHTAALRQRMAKADPERARLVNIEGTRFITNISSSNNIPLIYISSDTIYGTALESDKPISENFPIDPQTLYSQTKAEAEEIVKKYDKAIILRSTSLYAPWPGSASTFNEIIRDIIKAGIKGENFEMAVPFAEKSEQLYVKDLAQAIMNALEANSLPDRIFNIGAGELISYQDIAKVAKDLFKIEVKLSDVDFGKERVQSVRTKPLDITRAKAELNYTPLYHLASAMSDYAAAIKPW